jgi:hypothetical protein
VGLHLQGFLPIARIRPGLLVRVVIGTPRLWLLDCYRDLTLWICAGLVLVRDSSVLSRGFIQLVFVSADCVLIERSYGRVYCVCEGSKLTIKVFWIGRRQDWSLDRVFPYTTGVETRTAIEAAVPQIHL